MLSIVHLFDFSVFVFFTVQHCGFTALWLISELHPGLILNKFDIVNIIFNVMDIYGSAFCKLNRGEKCFQVNEQIFARMFSFKQS